MHFKVLTIVLQSREIICHTRGSEKKNKNMFFYQNLNWEEKHDRLQTPKSHLTIDPNDHEAKFSNERFSKI